MNQAERSRIQPGRQLIIYFSRADENYAVGRIDKGSTEIAAD